MTRQFLLEAYGSEATGLAIDRLVPRGEACPRMETTRHRRSVLLPAPTARYMARRVLAVLADSSTEQSVRRREHSPAIVKAQHEGTARGRG